MPTKRRSLRSQLASRSAIGLERLSVASVLASNAAWLIAAAGAAAGAETVVSVPAVAGGIATTLQAQKSATGKTLPKFKATAEIRLDRSRGSVIRTVLPAIIACIAESACDAAHGTAS